LPRREEAPRNDVLVDRTSANGKKFFGSFFQKRTASFLADELVGVEVFDGDGF